MNAATKPRSARKIAEEAAGFGSSSDSAADPRACFAHGCPLRGSIDLGGSGHVARLLQDFEHRVGARATKPQPLLPQRTWPAMQGAAA